jgi:hypothetical protein
VRHENSGDPDAVLSFRRDALYQRETDFNWSWPMTKTIFDDLLPPPRDLDAFVAIHVLGWQGVRWHQGHNVYVGTDPESTVESQVPRFTEQQDLVTAIQTALYRLGYSVQATPVPEGWRVQVGETAATSRTLPLALCAAVWHVLHRAP